MDSNILAALNHLDPAAMSYSEWLSVGMALKAEGCSVEVWDEWSRNDSRYKRGECARKWESFRGAATPVTGATVVQMAKDRGWVPGYQGEAGIMDWNDVISDDRTFYPPTPRTWDPVNELRTYLEILFDPDDRVSYVTNDVWQNSEGEWAPGRGVFDRTAGELIESLKRHPEDLGATIGDWKPECGAWIRFNPVDGHGVRNENVTKFRFALVESDSMTLAEQEELYRKLELPIAALVNSGGRSLHAIVCIDAPDYDEYRKRVSFLYDFLERNGVKVDKQNRNPGRLSRLPGVTRNGNRQYLAGTNLGRKSWGDWLDFVEDADDVLPPFVKLSDFRNDPPVLSEELIEGVLRRGHKMLISGSSKAGKSFLLMELCIDLAEGRPWLKFRCKKSKVLYINLEIDPASCINRFLTIYQAMGLDPLHMDDITVWNLRGHAVPLDKLVPKLVRRIRDLRYDAVIIDPIYKVITGDENSASEMGAFCNLFDKICAETGCAAIYCHHHSKGAQGAKRAIDRASGSGVFARDPDAQLDMIELQMDDTSKNMICDAGSTPWRLEGSLREFPNFEPFEFWFRYPLHVTDEKGDLGSFPAIGTAEAGRILSGKSKTPDECANELRMAYAVQNLDGRGVALSDMAVYLGIKERSVRDRVKALPDEFKVIQGKVIKLRND